jgi:hypothetical protein
VIGFLDRQVLYLQAEQPAVRKSGYDLEGLIETETVETVNWNRELEFFREVDLNRPALRDFFTITRHTDPATGHSIERYERVPGAGTRIHFLQVEMDAGQQLRQLKAATEQNNPLFYTQRNLQLTCTPSPDQSRISSYTVTGVQKLIFTDSAHYTLKAEVLY